MLVIAGNLTGPPAFLVKMMIKITMMVTMTMMMMKMMIAMMMTKMTMAMKMTMAKTTFAMAIGKEEDLAAAINLSYSTWQQQDSLLPLSQHRPASSHPNLSSPSCPDLSSLCNRPSGLTSHHVHT